MATDSVLGNGDSKAIGCFEYVSELHKGFFGSVWLACATSPEYSGDVVFVRRIDVAGDVDEVSAAAVAKAAERAKGVRHVALAGTVDVIREGAELAIVSEYQEAEPLRTMLRLAGIGRKPVPPGVVVRVALDLLDACIHLHEHDVLGALTADNVLVGSDGMSRVFEPIVSQVAASAPAWRDQPKRATYAAPEQLGDDAGDERSDIFTLGVLMWEMLRNRPLFGGATFAQVAERVRTAPIGRADALKPAGGEAIPKELANLVERAVSRAPETRFATAAEMVEALEACGPAKHADVAAYVADLLAEGFAVQRRKLAGRKLAGGRRAGETGLAALDALPAAEADVSESNPASGLQEGDAPSVGGEAAAGTAARAAPTKRREVQRTLLGMAVPVVQPAEAEPAPALASSGKPAVNKPKFPPSRAAVEVLEVEPEPPSRALEGSSSHSKSSLEEPELDSDLSLEEADDDEAELAAATGFDAKRVDSEPQEPAAAAREGFDVLSIADDPSDPDDPSGEIAAALERQRLLEEATSQRAPAKAAPVNGTENDLTAKASRSATVKVAMGVAAAVILAVVAYLALGRSLEKAADPAPGASARSATVEPRPNVEASSAAPAESTKAVQAAASAATAEVAVPVESVAPPVVAPPVVAAPVVAAPVVAAPVVAPRVVSPQGLPKTPGPAATSRKYIPDGI